MGKKLSTRQAYGATLAEIGADKRVVVMDADLSKSTNTDTFRQVYPDRHFNMGIAEGNMMSVAAGLASTGKIVFASSFAMFATARAAEQIRNSIAYPKLNVKVCASHAGITVGEDGASHQCIEDIAIMRAIPNMVIMNPCDDDTTQAAIKAAYAHEGPCYVRLGRLAVEPVYDENVKFELGKGIQIRDGKDVAIIATGLMVQEAIKAADLLAAEGISARVIDMHTIKPIDKDMIVKASKEIGVIVTCEEHNIIGGLGSAVAEVVAEEAPCKVKRVCVKDKFGKSGTPAELMKLYEMTAEDIVKAVKEAI